MKDTDPKPPASPEERDKQLRDPEVRAASSTEAAPQESLKLNGGGGGFNGW